MHWTEDLAHDVMALCMKLRGKWWANHFFQNQEVKDLYAKIVESGVDVLFAFVTSEEMAQKVAIITDMKPMLSKEEIQRMVTQMREEEK